jgi:AcrR family transcriptional regulator
MSDSVKRSYRSELRRKQAQATRQRILEAATGLFVERGYDGATVEMIAERAGVSAPTVYGSVGSKRELLSATVRSAVRAGVDEQPLLEQAGPQSVRSAPSQTEQLRRFSLDVADRLERVGPLMDVVTSAALHEPEVDALRRQMLDGRLKSYRAMIGWLRENGELRPGLTPSEAAEIVWALASPEMHRLLRRERGWSRRRFARWLEESLNDLLLED